jgi:hypothetical protein
MKATIELGKNSQDFILNRKIFKTGSTGFHGFGKLAVSEDEKYQVNILVIRIGSKPVHPAIKENASVGVKKKK